MEFTDTKIYEPQYQHQCFRIWQNEQAAKRRSSHTQFNLYQCRSLERLAEHSQWKMDAVREADTARDIVERRLSQACDCENCHTTKSRSNSTDSSATSLTSEAASPTNSFDGCRDYKYSSRRRAGSRLPGSTPKSPTMGESQAGLVSSTPPTSRHHQRKQ